MSLLNTDNSEKAKDKKATRTGTDYGDRTSQAWRMFTLLQKVAGISDYTAHLDNGSTIMSIFNKVEDELWRFYNHTGTTMEDLQAMQQVITHAVSEETDLAARIAQTSFLTGRTRGQNLVLQVKKWLDTVNTIIEQRLVLHSATTSTSQDGAYDPSQYSHSEGSASQPNTRGSVGGHGSGQGGSSGHNPRPPGGYFDRRGKWHDNPS